MRSSQLPHGPVNPKHVPRRPLIIVLSATATLVAADLAVRWNESSVLRYENNVYARKTAALAQARAPAMLLLGSSRVRYGFVPEEFAAATGQRAFNLGVPNAKVVEWRMLARAARRIHPAQRIVLGVNCGEFRGNYQPEDAARLYFRADDFRRYVASHGWSGPVAGAFLKGAATPLWSAYGHRFALRLAVEDRLGVAEWGVATLAGEFRAAADRGVSADGNDHPWQADPPDEAFASQVAAGRYDARAMRPPPFDAAAPAFAEFALLLREIRQHGADAMVVYMPNCPALEARWACVEPVMRARIEEICHAAGTAWMTLADVPRTDADFVDEAHAGEPLARRFSRRVAEQIIALGWIDRPDLAMRGEP